jgi:hypothetical protein
MDDPVDLMPRVMGRTHVVEWEDIPAKKQLNIITNKKYAYWHDISISDTGGQKR